MVTFYALLAVAAFGLGSLAAVSGNRVLVGEFLHEPSAGWRACGILLAGATMSWCALMALAAR